MSGRILLDTNIVIAIFVRDAAVLDQLQTAQEVFVPSIVLGELYYGALNSTRSAQNIARLEAFRAASAVVDCNAETSVYYGDLKFALKQNGTPIPENDIWIAAIPGAWLDRPCCASGGSRGSHFWASSVECACSWYTKAAVF